MNAIKKWRKAGWTAMAGLLLTGLASARGESDYIVNNFDSEEEGASWSRWWGSAEQTYEFDWSMDAANDSNSGSLKATIGFDLAAYAGDNQFAVQRAFNESAILDGTKYTAIEFDIRVDPSSPLNGNGNFGSLEFGLRANDSSWTTIPLGPLTLTTNAADVWTHVSAPIDSTLKLLDTSAGVWFKIWSGGSPGGLTGTTVFWVDNITLIGNTNDEVVLPTMALSRKVVPGLEVAASASGQQYQRQNIATIAADAEGNPHYYSWVSRTQPVTYSMTVKSFPDTNYAGFQAHLFIVPNAGMPYGSADASIDWNAPNMIYLQLANQSDGTAAARFMYKTNLPSGNAMLWNQDPANGAVGTLAFLTNATATGTWNLTFNNDAAVTVTSPSGSSTNFAIPADAAALFADAVTVYFGVQPNQTANLGQGAVFSRLQISGTETPLDDTFTAETLDSSIWQVVAADSAGISVVPSNAAFWLSWAAPATGFGVQASTSLAAGSWFDPGLTNVVQVSGTKKVLVTTGSITNAATFYRLIK